VLKGTTALKVFYPHLIHITYLAHRLNRVAEQIQGNFPKVNNLILSTKNIKASLQIEMYRDKPPLFYCLWNLSSPNKEH
jgi:hypothetical protein